MEKNSSTIFAAMSLLLIAALLVYIPKTGHKIDTPVNTVSIKQTPLTLYFNTNKALNEHFESTNYFWPIDNINFIPGNLIRSMPEDAKLVNDIHTRKTVFIRVMLPIILTEQKRIRNSRQMLKLALKTSDKKYKNAHQKIHRLFEEYKISDKLSFAEKSRILLHHFDELPLTLILAQAAIESGWGTSRFTRVGNSLFGEWTYIKGEGIIPEGRDDGKTHQIKAFPSLQSSIASYIKNINRNNAYKELRQIRAEMRLKKQPLDSRKLAQGLHRYSQKGQAYVDSVLSILDSKEFKLIEKLNLDGNSM